jgi:hypothetical protein
MEPRKHSQLDPTIAKEIATEIASYSRLELTRGAQEHPTTTFGLPTR